ncbi:MAG: Xaa-Pro aminopeptidase [Candidatus Marivariicella framensis]|jgi:Xaa-Pro aminopeptidase|tara:strand:+ start:72 stop:1691 length:1620 start_codon:yes stop_codon:yes gene_type:complete
MTTKTLYKFLIIYSLLLHVDLIAQDKYGISNEFHLKNRNNLRDQMPDNSVSVLFSNPVRNRSNDVYYSYHPDPNYYYLSGWREPHSVLVIFKNNIKDSIGSYNEILFVRERNPDDEQWNGKRKGVEGARKLGFDRVLSKKSFSKMNFNFDNFNKVLLNPFQTDVKDIIADESDLFDLQNQLKNKINYPNDFNPEVFKWYNLIYSVNNKDIERLKKQLRFFSNRNKHLLNDKIIQKFISINTEDFMKEVNSDSSFFIPEFNFDFDLLDKYLTNQREIKSTEEVDLIRKAVAISSIGQSEVMKAVKPGMSEREIQGLHQYIYKRYGAAHEGYPSIVGSGENACILHYITNDKTNIKNQLVLMDLGAEYGGYTADVTRTIPVNGKFTDEQRLIYKIVYDAQEAGIEMAKKGNSFSQIYEATKMVALDGLIELEIIKDEKELRTYYPHGVAHHIGLDVHDPGNYGLLSENMVITVEPGIYIPEGSNCDPKWWSIGIRIEDDILITNTGNENLSKFAPRKWDLIEKTMILKSPLDNFNLPNLSN